jgi:hypothetical protein
MNPVERRKMSRLVKWWCTPGDFFLDFQRTQLTRKSPFTDILDKDDVETVLEKVLVSFNKGGHALDRILGMLRYKMEYDTLGEVEERECAVDFEANTYRFP